MPYHFSDITLSQPVKFHPYQPFGLLYCRSDLSIRIDTQTIYASTGDILLYHQQTPIQLIATQPAAQLKYFAWSTTFVTKQLLPACYHLPLLRDFFESAHGQADYLFFRSSMTPIIQQCADLLFTLLDQPATTSTYETTTFYLTAALLHQLHQAHPDILSITNSTMMPQHLAGTFLKYIEEHLKDITIQQMARDFSYHPAYFSKLFKQLMNTTFSEKVKDIRYEKVEQLLTHGELPIHDIMQQVGYHDAGAFHKNFKRRYGYTPLQYRKQAHQKANDSYSI